MLHKTRVASISSGERVSNIAAGIEDPAAATPSAVEGVAPRSLTAVGGQETRCERQTASESDQTLATGLASDMSTIVYSEHYLAQIRTGKCIRRQQC